MKCLGGGRGHSDLCGNMIGCCVWEHGICYAVSPASFCVIPALSKEPVKIEENIWHIACGVFDGYSCSVCREQSITNIDVVDLKNSQTDLLTSNDVRRVIYPNLSECR